MSVLCNLTSAEEVSKLSAKELNLVLKQNGKATKGSRRHKIVIACEVLGIKDRPQSFQHILTDVKNSKVGWTKDIRKCPSLTLQSVSDYLLRAHDTVTHTDTGKIEKFTVANMKRYKTLRSYDLYRSGHIHSMAFNSLGGGDRCALRSRCNPSFDTSGTIYECIVLLDTIAEVPLCSSCTCTAGQGEACTHVAALLFALEDFTSLGHHALPDDPASTEILCAWNAPKDAKVDPIPLNEISFKQHAPDKPDSRKSKRALSDFNPVAPNKRKVDETRYIRLIHDLQMCHPTAPFLTIADFALGKHSGEATNLISPVTELPEAVTEYWPPLVPAAVVNVTTCKAQPRTLIEMITEFTASLSTPAITPTDGLVESVMQILTITDDVQTHIEQLTIGQSENTLWHHYKKGIVSGSSVHSVHTRMNGVTSGRVKEANNLISQCLAEKAKFKGNRATRYGLFNEPKAAKEYEKVVGATHVNFRLTVSGLIVDTDHCFIGASPDRIAHCDCHDSWVVEIKCPATMSDAPKGSFCQLQFIDGDMKLQKSHKYFSQVLLYMAVCKVKHADFVVWSPNELLIIPLEFDESMWQDMLSNILYFYRRFMIPRLLHVPTVSIGGNSV